MSRRGERAARALIATACLSAAAWADPPEATRSESTAAEPAADPATQRAREEFLEGARLSKAAQWGEALSAFERSAAAKPHAVTTFNIGVCERALARYTRARSAFKLALRQNGASGGTQLAAAFVEEARTYLEEIESLLVRARVRLSPKSAAIAVDGRPLVRDEHASGDAPLVAGLAPSGRGKPVPADRFVLLMDPGVNVITLTRAGYADAVINRTDAPGSTPEIALALDRLPASLRVGSNRQSAVVKIDGTDVGISPVQLTRPAGTYAVVVEKPGYTPYRTSVRLAPGGRAELMATLEPEPTPLTSNWWFWTGATAVVAGAALGTYFLTRPDPERPPLDGGGLGWTLEVR